MKLSLRAFAWALLGTLLIQAAWILVVPPFRGLDEHDHAYKAAAVARGDWSPHHAPSSQGWGEFVTVPRDLVVAAQPVCEAFVYTTRDNCRPGAEQGSGLVEVASTAARYHPAFYFVIGSAALPFSGTTSFYAMRAASALMSALLLAAAFATARSWSRSSWPATTMLLAATPVLFYSTALAAPNGVELAAASLLWVSLLGVARMPAGSPEVARYLTLATVGAVPLVTVRALGPLWLALILATCALLMSREQLLEVVRRRRARACGAVVALTTVGAVFWTLVARTNEVTSRGEPYEGLWTGLPKQVVVWVAQSVAAFPGRYEPAPLVLYAVAFTAWWAVLALAWRTATRRQRVGLVVVVVLTTLVPVAVTIRAFSDAGFVWQGRYGYPYAMGFLLICGLVLDQSRRLKGIHRVPRVVPVVVAGVVLTVTSLIGLLDVLADQRRASPLAGTDAWLMPSPLVVVAVTLSGATLLGLASLRSASALPPAEDPEGPAGRADADPTWSHEAVAETHR